MFFLELFFGLKSLYRNLLSLEFFNSNEVPGLPFCSLIRIIQDFIQDTEDGLTVRKRSVIYNKLIYILMSTRRNYSELNGLSDKICLSL